MPPANIRLGNDTRCFRINVSDKDMTQFKLDPRTINHFVKAANKAQVMTPLAEPASLVSKTRHD